MGQDAREGAKAPENPSYRGSEVILAVAVYSGHLHGALCRPVSIPHCLPFPAD